MNASEFFLQRTTRTDTDNFTTTNLTIAALLTSHLSKDFPRPNGSDAPSE